MHNLYMIKVYTSETCVKCPQVKKYLNLKGAKFVEVDVSDRANMAELRQLTGYTTVPVIISGTDVVRGLDIYKLNKIIQKQNQAYRASQVV